MSSNELNFDKSNQMLQSERNCINFDGSRKFNVNYKAMSYDDACFVDTQTRQAIGPGNYAVTNYFDECDCMMPQTVKNATDNVAVPLGRNGYGTEQACVVDTGSSMRIGLQRRYPKCPQQLFERPYKTVAYMGRGYLKPDDETILIHGEQVSTKKSCGALSGVTIPQQYMPLVDHLAFNVQNEKHIVQEVFPGWRRGGNNSRLVIRSQDYSSRCGKAYMDKSTNPYFWANKGNLLQE
jgi:hypothetical protein